MNDPDETGRKTSSTLVTCGILAAVFGIGGVAILGVAGFFAWRYYVGEGIAVDDAVGFHRPCKEADRSVRAPVG